MNDKFKDGASFSDLMTGVKRLENSRVNTYQDRIKKEPLPLKRIKPLDPAIDFSTISYQFLSDISDSYFDSGIQKKQQKKMRQGLLGIDDRLDLHGCNQQQATVALLQFVEQALASGFRFLIIVHGKGGRSDTQAVLKPLVHHWFAQQSTVLAWCPAQPKHGGSGASYVYLRRLASD
jgi:DNA-nicking Smr family endonuclease